MKTVDEILQKIKNGFEVNIYGNVWIGMYGPTAVRFYVKHDPYGIEVSAMACVEGLEYAIADFMEMYAVAVEERIAVMRAKVAALRACGMDYRGQE